MGWRRASTGTGQEVPRRRGRTWLVVSVVAVVVLTASGFALHTMVSPSAPRATERTVTVTTQTVRNTVDATGTLEPKQRADLSFSGSGTVTAVDVGVGDSVHKGQVLATIDDATLRANVDAAK